MPQSTSPSKSDCGFLFWQTGLGVLLYFWQSSQFQVFFFFRWKTPDNFCTLKYHRKTHKPSIFVCIWLHFYFSNENYYFQGGHLKYFSYSFRIVAVWLWPVWTGAKGTPDPPAIMHGKATPHRLSVFCLLSTTPQLHFPLQWSNILILYFNIIGVEYVFRSGIWLNSTCNDKRYMNVCFPFTVKSVIVL